MKFVLSVWDCTLFTANCFCSNQRTCSPWNLWQRSTALSVVCKYGAIPTSFEKTSQAIPTESTPSTLSTLPLDPLVSLPLFTVAVIYIGGSPFPPLRQHNSDSSFRVAVGGIYQPVILLKKSFIPNLSVIILTCDRLRLTTLPLTISNLPRKNILSNDPSTVLASTILLLVIISLLLRPTCCFTIL